MFTNHYHFKNKCLLQIEESINVPLHSFFVKNADSIRMHYSIGRSRYYICLASPIEVAIFLKNNDIIHSYEIEEGAVVNMFKHEIGVGSYNNIPIQYLIKIPFTWEDISLTAAQVQTLAAKVEWQRIMQQLNSMSVCDVIIDLAKQLFTTAA